MKICICTTPIRPLPTRYPPFGSMAIIQSLRKIGEQADFYNIDYFRYTREEVRCHFRDNQYDIVGISAVVSTAYAYTKWLIECIKSVSPQTCVVVGGNLAAGAEILLRKAKADFCVVGDGETVIRNLVSALRDDPGSAAQWPSIKGICYLEADGKFNFTGYGERIPAEMIEWPDYDILERDGSIAHFITDKVDARFDGHTFSLAGGERLATVVMAKGCVARCTFCHRWEKGYRARPVDQIVDHIKYLKEKYNVRFVDIADENFGSDRELASELATRLHELGMIWYAAGVRTKTVTKESLAHWRANGCGSVIYGVESGSQTILDVMEKNTTVEQNVNAMIWTSEVGMGTILQFVIGMPGETDATIQETIEYINRVAPYMKFWENKAPSEMVSINYAQALPGTPLYEYARANGFIGKTIEDEERYLMRISDTDAYAEDHFINYTGLPLLKVLMWRPSILSKVDAAHLLRNNPQASLSLMQVTGYYVKMVLLRIARRLGIADWIFGVNQASAANDAFKDYAAQSGYFNIHANLKFSPMLLNPVTKWAFYPLLAFVIAFYRTKSFTKGVKLISEHLLWSIRGSKLPQHLPKQSLRKVVTLVRTRNEDALDRMLPLRSGR